MLLQKIALLLSALIVSIINTMAVNNYAGIYTLTQVYDSETGIVPLPKEFKIRFQRAANNHYNLGMKLGNSMGGTVVVSEASSEQGRDAVKAGPIRSTMMMPAQDVFAVEKAIGKIMPHMEFIHFEGDDIVMEGPKGSMRFTKKE